MRHGTTDQDVPGQEASSGWGGIGLNKEGISKIHKAADFLQDFPIQEIFHSDLNRSAQSAAIIASRLNIPAIPSFDLRPWNTGKYSGVPESSVKGELEWYFDHPCIEVPSGEAYDKSYERWAGKFGWLVRYIRSQKAPIAVLTHSINIFSMPSLLTNAAKPARLKGKPGTGGIVGVRLIGGSFDVKVLLDIPSLKGET